MTDECPCESPKVATDQWLVRSGANEYVFTKLSDAERAIDWMENKGQACTVAHLKGDLQCRTQP
jgi:GTP-dependent phosphoenolpyruvate carboxykinase